MKTRQMTPFFSSNCLGTLFLHLEIVQIHFHGVPPLAYSGLQNTLILEVKTVRLGICPVRLRKFTH